MERERKGEKMCLDVENGGRGNVVKQLRGMLADKGFAWVLWRNG